MPVIWKRHTYGSSQIPADALRPACRVRLQYSPGAPVVEDSYITDMIDWWYVVEYEAVVANSEPTPEVKASAAPVWPLTEKVYAAYCLPAFQWTLLGFVSTPVFLVAFAVSALLDLVFNRIPR